MKGIISEFNQKEYDVPEPSEFVAIVSEAKEKLGKDFTEGALEIMSEWSNRTDGYRRKTLGESPDSNLWDAQIMSFIVDEFLSEVGDEAEAKGFPDLAEKAREMERTIPYSLSDADETSMYFDEGRCTEEKLFKEYTGCSGRPNPVLDDVTHIAHMWNFTRDVLKEIAPERLKEVQQESKKQSETSAPETKSATGVMLPLSKSLIKPVKNQQGMLTASIGLDSEHGTYGRMFFPESIVKQSRTQADMVFLPMSADKEYKVVFGDKDNRDVVKMTGQEIADANKSYVNSRRKERMQNLETALGDVSEPQQETDGLSISD